MSDTLAWGLRDSWDNAWHNFNAEEVTIKEPEPAWYSKAGSWAGGFFGDLAKSGATDVSNALKGRIQQDIYKKVVGQGEDYSASDVGTPRVQDQSNRTSFIPSFMLPASKIPEKAETSKIGGVVPAGMGKYLLFGGLALGGFFLIRKFI